MVFKFPCITVVLFVPEPVFPMVIFEAVMSENIVLLSSSPPNMFPLTSRWFPNFTVEEPAPIVISAFVVEKIFLFSATLSVVILLPICKSFAIFTVLVEPPIVSTFGPISENIDLFPAAPAKISCDTRKFPPATTVLLFPPIVIVLLVFISTKISLSSLTSVVICSFICNVFFAIILPLPEPPIIISPLDTLENIDLVSSWSANIFPEILIFPLVVVVVPVPPIVISAFVTFVNISFAKLL